MSVFDGHCYSLQWNKKENIVSEFGFTPKKGSICHIVLPALGQYFTSLHNTSHNANYHLAQTVSVSREIVVPFRRLSTLMIGSV